MNSFGLIIAFVRPFIFSGILSYGSRIPGIQKRRNYLISQMNFGEVYISFEKNKTNKSNETDK